MRNDRSRARRLATLLAAVMLVAGGVVALTATPARADTLITVTTTADTVDGGDGLTSLREAIDQANAAPQPVQITLASSATYDLSYCVPVGGENGVNRTGALGLTTVQPVAIHGSGSTIHQSCSSALVLRTTSSPLSLDHLTVDHGTQGAIDAESGLSADHLSVTATVATTGIGYAVNAARSVSIVDSSIDGTLDGAGLGVNGGQTTGPTPDTLTLTRATIANNALGSHIGVLAAGVYSVLATTMTDSVVSGNTATTGGVSTIAGGITVKAQLTVSGSHIQANQGRTGGVFGVPADLTDTQVSNNHGDAVGGVLGEFALERTTVDGNTSPLFGGVLGSGTVDRSTIGGNRGGAAGAGVVADGTLSITRSTISDNQGGSVVGGFVLDTETAATPGPTSPPHLDVRSSTFAGNTATGAGAADDIRFVNVLTLPPPPDNANGSVTTEATVFGSSGGGKPPCVLDGHPVTSLGVNFSVDASCGLGAGDLVNLGDPELLPLEATQTSPLQVRFPGRGSVLRDQIDPGAHGCTGTDQVGISVPQSRRCDIGAAEVVLGGYHPVTPVRVYDSRDAHDPIGSGATRAIPVMDNPQFASKLSAGVFNVTAVNPSADSHLTIWPSDGNKPETSNLNVSPHETIANQVVVPLGTGASPGTVDVFNNAGAVDVVIDWVGAYDDGTQQGSTDCPCGDGIVPLATPIRALDTRDGTGGPQMAFGPKEHRTLSLGGLGLPADVDAVSLNITITGADAASHLSVGPGSVPFTGVSTLNWTAGETIANGATVQVPPGKDITFFNNDGHVQVIVDVVASYSPTAAARFRVIDPGRILDTRFNGPAGAANPFGPTETRTFDATEAISSNPVGLPAVWLNMTGVQASAATHLTVWPANVGLPNTSTLNVPAHGTRANLTIAGLDPTGSIKIRNNAGQMNVLADLFGWFATNG